MASTASYPLSLHDALPIFPEEDAGPLAAEQPRGLLGDVLQQRDRLALLDELLPDGDQGLQALAALNEVVPGAGPDRKSTRLNSSNANISYAVICLKQSKPK